jgi:quercetin dioxygenase-like cupin family protein
MLGATAAMAHSAPTHAKDAEPMVVTNPQTLKYTAVPGLPSCATAAILRGDPRSGPAWVLLKLASGCRVPSHWHTANEDLVIISGQGSLMMQDGGQRLQFAPGAYASLPNHHVHQASCSRSCLLFSIADGAFDIHYVDANGEEISADKALKQPARTKGKKK